MEGLVRVTRDCAVVATSIITPQTRIWRWLFRHSVIILLYFGVLVEVIIIFGGTIIDGACDCDPTASKNTGSTTRDSRDALTRPIMW